MKIFVKSCLVAGAAAILMFGCAQVYNEDCNSGGFLGGGSSGYGDWGYDNSDYIPPGLQRLPGDWLSPGEEASFTRLVLGGDGSLLLQTVSDGQKQEVRGEYKCTDRILEVNIDNYHYQLTYNVEGSVLSLTIDDITTVFSAQSVKIN